MMFDDFELASRAEAIAKQYTMLTDSQRQQLTMEIYLAQVALSVALRQPPLVGGRMTNKTPLVRRGCGGMRLWASVTRIAKWFRR